MSPLSASALSGRPRRKYYNKLYLCVCVCVCVPVFIQRIGVVYLQNRTDSQKKIVDFRRLSKR
jgi:hypothetical protein